jgi:hypothetical protein
MRPLNFEEFDGLASSVSFSFIKDKNRILPIGEIFLKIESGMINSTDWIFETTLELRDMKHIMNIQKCLRKFQPIGKLSTLSENRKRTNIARSQFAFNTKAMNAF